MKKLKGSLGGEYHWREYRINSLLPVASRSDRVLLYGCGDAGERKFLHELGFKTFAFDIRRTTGTDFIADGHFLPIKDHSFRIVLSMQVFEHLHSPWVAVPEIARILLPGGYLIGSVAFLKPFHDSYFHMTHRGVARLLSASGLKLENALGLQSLTHSIYGSILPLNRSISRMVFGCIDRIVFGVRAALWSLVRGVRPTEPTDRFDAGLKMSFKTFDSLRFAPAIVFKARKATDR